MSGLVDQVRGFVGVATCPLTLTRERHHTNYLPVPDELALF